MQNKSEKRVNNSCVQSVYPASEDARSTGGRGSLAARPAAERAPLIHWMDDRRRAKLSEHLSQAMVELYV